MFARAAAQLTGLPPKVERWSPGWKTAAADAAGHLRGLQPIAILVPQVFGECVRHAKMLTPMKTRGKPV